MSLTTFSEKVSFSEMIFGKNTIVITDLHNENSSLECVKDSLNDIQCFQFNQH